MAKSKQPTLRQLNYLRALYRDLHFKHAAHSCSISQAAFSTSIINLEQALGANLIDRTNKQVVFTALGKMVIEQADIVLQEVKKLQEIADNNSTLFLSHLRMGVIPTIAPFMLPKVLTKIREKWPKMHIAIHEDLTVNLHEALLNGELDLLLLALPFSLKGVETLALFRDHFKIAYHKNTSFFSPPDYLESMLPDGSILLLKDGHCLRNHALSACNVENADKVSSYKVTSMHTLVQMIQSDLGVSFIPDLAIRAGILKHTSVKTLDMPAYAFREIGFVWRKGTRQGEEFSQFAQTFVSMAGIDPRPMY